jgi:acetyl esterase/lipase
VKKYKEDKRVKNVIGLGFSAGGHNLLEVALHKNIYGAEFDLIMLAYPVVSSDNSIWHQGSFKYLLGDKINDDKLLYRLSEEYEVTNEAPKLFVWSTFADVSVHVFNTITLASVYKMNGVEVELHVFPYGAHGFSVANKYSAEGMEGKVDPYIARWVNLADEWIKKNLN